MRRRDTLVENEHRMVRAWFLVVILASVGIAGAGATYDDVPWEPAYKIKPGEEARLTAADVVGPDGIVYPNWTRCGVQGGIPAVAVVARIEDYGAVANDSLDDSQALQAACDAVGRTGGAVLIGEGTYYLDRPVTVRHDGVVIRGQGAERTRVLFRYAIPEPGVTLYSPRADATVGRNTRIEMHCRPSGLAKMTLLVDETPIGTWTRGQHSGNTFAYSRYGRDIGGQIPDGPHRLKAVAEYQEGSTRAAEIPVVLDRQFDDR